MTTTPGGGPEAARSRATSKATNPPNEYPSNTDTCPLPAMIRSAKIRASSGIRRSGSARPAVPG